MTLKEFAKLPPVEWQEAYDRLTVNERYALDNDAADLAIKYTRISRYVATRAYGGRNGHADAVRAQNIGVRKVRRALGFTYPDDPITF